MQFTKFRLIGSPTSFIDLPVVGAYASPSDKFKLVSADGLGPTEVEVSISSSLSGIGKHQGSKPMNREPMFLIGLQPDWSVNETPASLRAKIYKLLNPPTSTGGIQIQIMDGDTIVALASAFVSKIEINPFADQPQVQVTAKCLSPYWASPVDVDVKPATNVTAFAIENEGDAPAGFKSVVRLTANLSSWEMSNQDNGETIYIVYNFKNGDEITINTEPGSRDVSVYQPGTDVTTSLLGGMSSDSDWMMLSEGVNHFYHWADTFEWVSLTYRPKHQGV